MIEVFKITHDLYDPDVILLRSTPPDSQCADK